MTDVVDFFALSGFSLIAGSSFLFTAAANDSFPPISLTFLRLAGGSIGLLISNLCVDRLRNARKASKHELCSLALVGTLNTTLPYVLFAAALDGGVSVGLSASLVASGPIFAFIISMLFFGRAFIAQLHWKHFAGLLIGFVGIVFLAAYKQYGKTGGDNEFIAVALLISGVASKASAAVLMQMHNLRFKGNLSPLTQAFVQAAFGMILALLLSLCLDCDHLTPNRLDKKGLTQRSCYEFLVRAAPDAWLSVAYLAFFASCLVYLLQFLLLQRVGAVRQMLVDWVTPIVGIVEGIAFRNEWASITWQQGTLFLIGAFLSFIGAAVLHWVGHPETSYAPSQSFLNRKWEAVSPTPAGGQC